MTNREQKPTSKGNSRKGKQLLDPSMFYGVVVSTLDSESNDPSSTLGITLVQFISNYVDYK